MDRQDESNPVNQPRASPDLVRPRPSRAEYERKQRIFNERLGAWRQKLSTLQERLCDDLVHIAIVNREALDKNPLDWVRRCIEDFWAGRRAGFRNWVILACDAEDVDPGWSAPGWLLDQIPDANLEKLITVYPLVETISGQLTEPYTHEILSSIVGVIQIRLERAKLRALDPAAITFASESTAGTSVGLEILAGRVNEAVEAIARTYGEAWNREFFESHSQLYAELHAGETVAGQRDSEPHQQPPKPAMEPRRPPHKATALPVSASPRAKKLRPLLEPMGDLSELQKRRSLSQDEAARALAYTTRNIRYLAKSKKLTRTPKGRIAVDDKFAAEFRSRHLPASQ